MSYEITNCSLCSDFYLGENICSRCKEAIARDEAMDKATRMNLRAATAFDLKPGAEVVYWGIKKCPEFGVIVGKVRWTEADGLPERAWDVRLADGTMRWGFLDQFEVEDTAANATEAARWWSKPITTKHGPWLTCGARKATSLDATSSFARRQKRLWIATRSPAAKCQSTAKTVTTRSALSASSQNPTTENPMKLYLSDFFAGLLGVCLVLAYYVGA